MDCDFIVVASAAAAAGAIRGAAPSGAVVGCVTGVESFGDDTMILRDHRDSKRK